MAWCSNNCPIGTLHDGVNKELIVLLQITTDDLLQAAQIEERGMLDRKERSLETWKQVAINEAAMAVVAVNFPDLKNIEFVRSLNSSIFTFFCHINSHSYAAALIYISILLVRIATEVNPLMSYFKK